MSLRRWSIDPPMARRTAEFTPRDAGTAPCAMRARAWLAALALALQIGPAVAAPTASDWSRWQRLAMVQPARAIDEIDAAPDDDTWPAADRLRRTLLRVRALVELGRGGETLPALDAVADAVRRSGEPALQAAWQAYRGDALRARGEVAPAREHLDRALQLARRGGDVELQSYVHTLRVQLAVDRREMGLAAAAVEADRQLAEAGGDNPLLRARNLYYAGVVHMTLRSHDRAAAALGDAAKRFRELGNPTWESDSERLLARVLNEAGRAGEALAPAARAVELLQALDDPVYLALARTAYASALAASGESARALALSRQALAGLGENGNLDMRLAALIDHADVLHRAGDTVRAHAVLRERIAPHLGGAAAANTDLRWRYERLRAEVLTALGSAAEAAPAWRAVLDLERAQAAQVLEERLQAQRGELEVRRLQGENVLLHQRSADAERALAAETNARQLATGAIAALVAAALGGLAWMRRVNRRIADVAARDALTGLLNRRSLSRIAGDVIARARGPRPPPAVVLIDVDHFKRVNDAHGHAAGDEVLRQVAQRLHAGLRRSDHLARWGGEEFLLLLPGSTLDEALALAERQRAAIAHPPIVVAAGAAPLVVTASIGIAAVAAGEPTLDAALERADRALYRAKAEGRDRVVGAGASWRPAAGESGFGRG